VDIVTVLISGAVGAITSAITAYFTSKLKVSEERQKWSRELSQRYAEALATNPGIAANMARQFGIALVVQRSPYPSDPKVQTKFYLLPNSRLVVGRHPSSDICLSDPKVSRSHAAFYADDTAVYIESMGAKHPVLVNGEAVSSRVRIRSGDQITIGATRFELIMLT
jgi:pSer/pThr/pTyr-binding forkhead associated (FHA) protein